MSILSVFMTHGLTSLIVTSECRNMMKQNQTSKSEWTGCIFDGTANLLRRFDADLSSIRRRRLPFSSVLSSLSIARLISLYDANSTTLSQFNTQHAAHYTRRTWKPDIYKLSCRMFVHSLY